jgi:hypothetical protein
MKASSGRGEARPAREANERARAARVLERVRALVRDYRELDVLQALLTKSMPGVPAPRPLGPWW